MDETGARRFEMVCPFCEAVNVIPRERFLEAHICGVCSRNMEQVDPVALTAGNFDAHANTDGALPMLVHFWAPWCGPCRKMKPRFETAGAELGRHARLATIDVDAEQGLAERFRVRAVPMLILLRGDKEVARSTGEPGNIVSWTRQALGL